MDGFGYNIGFNFDYSFLSNDFYFPIIDFSAYSFPVIQFPQIDFSCFVQNIWNFNAYPVTTELPSTSIYEPQQNQNKDNYKIGDNFTKTTSNLSSNTSLKGYSAKAGEKLANTALQQSVGFTGFCAKYVKNAVEQAGLGNYELGHAYQMPSILRHNKNFKELSTDIDVNKLPAGCILVYDKGAEGYSKKYGHTEITTGDGRAVSDGITENLYKKPSAIFMPVEQNDYA